MPIDASIYQMAGRGVKSMAEYDNEYSQARQNKLAEQLSGMKMDEYTRGLERNNRLTSLLGGFGPDASPDDQVNQLTRSGFLPEARSLAESAAKIAKEKREAEAFVTSNQNSVFELARKRYDTSQKTFGALAQRPDLSKELVLAEAQQMVDMGVISPEIFARLPATLPDDPVALRSNLRQRLSTQLSPEQIFTIYAPKPTEIKDGQQISFRDTNPNSPTYGQMTAGAPLQMQQTPDSVASNATSRENSIRTDNRARDFNSIQQDANNIKRLEAEKTSDLTKNSQIASFDTMLGTLDRLSQHPGLSRSVGVTGAFPTMPGSNSANFQAELNTFQSQAFLPMVAQLKGMGALSDAEGKKLTAAVGALDPKMGEKAFRESVGRITEDMQAARARLAGSVVPKPAPAATPTPAATNAQGWKLHTDAQGNRAYVSPDGKQFQEVK